MKTRLFATVSLLLVFQFCFLSCEKNPTNSENDTVKDIDGNVYQTVKIGDQWWMAENLKVTHYRNGDAIPNVTDGTEWSNLSTGAYCNYENDANNAVTYGSLYNWYAVDDSRNIAPKGWHVPSDAEWTTLTTYLGGESVAGVKLKSANGWNNDGNGTDEYSFAVLPGGYRFYFGTFDGMGYCAFFWSSTEGYSGYAWTRLLYYNYSDVSRLNGNKQYGFSVRCVRD